MPKKIHNHDHAPNGECLEVEWKGVADKKWENKESSQDLQIRVEKNHIEQLKVWRDEATKNNIAPF